MCDIILACYMYYLPAHELDKYITQKYQTDEDIDKHYEIRISKVPENDERADSDSPSISLEISASGLRTPKFSSTRNVFVTPESIHQQTVVDVLNTPEVQSSPSLKRRIDDEAPGEANENDIEKKITAGWLQTVVNNADVSVFGVLQICDKMEKRVGENILTMLKVSDGECVS